MGLEVAAIAGLAVSLAGTGIAAYSSYQQGQSQEAMAKRNASIASSAAANEAAVAAENSSRQRNQNRRQLSAIRARMAGGGTQIGMGSNLDTQAAAASELELQAMDLFRDGDARANQYRNQAAIGSWQGEQYGQAGTIGAIGSLIGGASSAYGQYSDAKSSGVFRTKGVA